jgi:hypothetical protein
VHHLPEQVKVVVEEDHLPGVEELRMLLHPLLLLDLDLQVQGGDLRSETYLGHI